MGTARRVLLLGDGRAQSKRHAQLRRPPLLHASSRQLRKHATYTCLNKQGRSAHVHGSGSTHALLPRATGRRRQAWELLCRDANAWKGWTDGRKMSP